MDAFEFLALLESPPNSCRFVLGPFDPGITLHRQQSRALNLIYCLQQANRLGEGTHIGVIGGGVAGVTAAAAAATLGYKVDIIERTHSLLHLQRGCDTRWLHPHIYSWPEVESQREYAGLPLLDWRSATASAVAKQILAGYLKIKSAQKDYIKEYFGSEVQSVETATKSGRKGVRVKWSSTTPKKNQNKIFDLVIFAVGFGVERGVGHAVPSYWRNDSFHQVDPRLNPTDRTTCLISGTGDGGLIDLMRVTLSDFDHSTIHNDLFPDMSEGLRARLLEIRRNWESSPVDQADPTWLFDRYVELEEAGSLDHVLNTLKIRIRPDTSITLNGLAKEFSSCLSLDTASMFSTLVAFCLWQNGSFVYLTGPATIAESRALVNKDKSDFKQFIFRHGADTLETYRLAHCPDAEQIIKHKDRLRQYFNTAKRQWDVGWWASNNDGVEPVSPPTVALATTFVSTLRDMLSAVLNSNETTESQDSIFRITLHRTTRIGDQFYYQQIARYATTGPSVPDGKIGRAFSVESGLGGLCCKLGRPVTLTRGEGFDDVKKVLEAGLTHARPIGVTTESFLSVPFFAPGGQEVNLLLYADSSAPSFFSDTVLRTIYIACKGFVDNLESMLKHKELCLSAPTVGGFPAELKMENLNTFNLDKNVISVDHEIFLGFLSALTFKTVGFFEVIQTSP